MKKTKFKKNGNWIVKGSISKYKSKWLEVVEDQVVQPNGRDGIYGIIKAKPGVAVLPIDADGNLYLIKEFRYPLGDWSVEVAGGGIEKNESPLAIGKRELKEELGITAKKWINLGIVRPLPAYIDCPNTMYVAKDLQIGKQNPDENEEIKVLKVSAKKAIEMVRKGEITEQRTCYLIMRAKFENLI